MSCTGNLESNWKAFKESWCDYRVATKLDKNSQEIQVDTLRGVMGQECKERIVSLALTEQDAKDPDHLLCTSAQRPV